MSKTYHATEMLVSLPVPISMLGAVYALLGGSTAVALARGSTAVEAEKGPSVLGDASQLLDKTDAELAAENGETGSTVAGEVDVAGTVFDPARHTGTKVKSGLWRLKTGLSRLPGEDVIPETGNASGAAAGAGTAGAGSSSATGAAAGTTGAVDDDDEFAAFANAAGAGAVTVKARVWNDADLSKLNNQAATKLGGADKVKELISKYVPAGETPHSRNIPADKREPFAVALEALAGIQYEG